MEHMDKELLGDMRDALHISTFAWAQILASSFPFPSLFPINRFSLLHIKPDLSPALVRQCHKFPNSFKDNPKLVVVFLLEHSRLTFQILVWALLGYVHDFMLFVQVV